MAPKKTLRELNRCAECSHTWYPRGKDRSAACPKCGSARVSGPEASPPVSVGLVLFLVGGGVAGGWIGGAVGRSSGSAAAVLMLPLVGFVAGMISAVFVQVAMVLLIDRVRAARADRAVLPTTGPAEGQGGADATVGIRGMPTFLPDRPEVRRFLSDVADDPHGFLEVSLAARGDGASELQAAALEFGLPAAKQLMAVSLANRLRIDGSEGSFFTDPSLQPFHGRFVPVRCYPSPLLVKAFEAQHPDTDPNEYFRGIEPLRVRESDLAEFGLETLVAMSRPPHLREGGSEAEVVWLFGEPGERLTKSERGRETVELRYRSKNTRTGRDVISLVVKLVDGKVVRWEERLEGAGVPRGRIRGKEVHAEATWSRVTEMRDAFATVCVALYLRDPSRPDARRERLVELTTALGPELHFGRRAELAELEPSSVLDDGWSHVPHRVFYMDASRGWEAAVWLKFDREVWTTAHAEVRAAARAVG